MHVTLSLSAFSHKDILRFWSKVNRASGQGPTGTCWGWHAGRRKAGYGQFHLNGKDEIASRVAWVLTNGNIPKDKPHILHTCDWPLCCNPAHLYAGTAAENVRDREVRTGNGMRLHPEKLKRGEAHWSRMYPDRVLQGTECHFAKVSQAVVLRIRKLYEEGEVFQRVLAERFGVSQAQVSRIVNFKSRCVR